jgi:threonine dehydratase
MRHTSSQLKFGYFYGMKPSLPTQKELQTVYNALKGRVHNTPVLRSSTLDDISGATLLFKCENFQKMGAFKMRGALNAILQLSDSQRNAGVVTHSSGNFGQAVALAAKNLGVKAYIVMPSNAPKVKIAAVKGYGGSITISEPTLASRELESQRLQRETGAIFLHPSNDLDVILGNATATMELLEYKEDLDYVFVPVGGGGLLAGTALAAHYFGKECSVIGGEPMEADDAWRSLRSGSIETNATANTIADGLRTNLGTVNFPIIQSLVTEIIRVEEREIVNALRLIWERMKIIVEPSCAVPLAALLKEKDRFRNKKIGIILSGGNVNIEDLPF